MRVTKLIREYVEDAVAKRMPMPAEPESITTLKAEWDELNDRIIKMVVAEYMAFFITHKGECIPYRCDDDFNDIDTIGHYVAKHAYANCGSNTLSFAAKKTYETECKTIRQRRQEIVNNILLSLELGANRAELDAMLAEVGK